MGVTEMKPVTLLCTAFLALLLTTDLAAQPDTLWTRTFGDYLLGQPSSENAYDGCHTSDGGYIVVAYWQNSKYVCLLKLDSLGYEVWKQKFQFTTTQQEGVRTVQEISDGGYILGGWYSDYGYAKAYLLRTDELGNELWRNDTYGNSFYTSGINAVKETPDGGFIASGDVNIDVSISSAYLLKTDSSGNEEFSKTFYTGGDESTFSDVALTGDGGYIFAGQEYGSDLYKNMILIKMDALGNQVWKKIFDKSERDGAYSVEQTTDGGYLICGGTKGFNMRSNMDIWLIKTDGDGSMEWDRTYGGSGYEISYSAIQTLYGSYIITGHSDSFSGEEGNYDVYIIRTDSEGNEVWSSTYGGSEWDLSLNIDQTFDGGYFVAGYTRSFGSGSDDVWVLKLEADEGLALEIEPHQDAVPASGTLDFEIAYSNFGAVTEYATIYFAAYRPGVSTPAWSTYNADFELPPTKFTKQYALPIPASAPVEPGYTFEAIIYNSDQEVLSQDSFEWEVLQEATMTP